MKVYYYCQTSNISVLFVGCLKVKDEQKVSVLETLLEAKDRREREIREEREKGKDFDVKVQEWERKIKLKRREVGGANAGANFTAHSKKQEKVFENRLDHVSALFLCLSFYVGGCWQRDQTFLGLRTDR